MRTLAFITLVSLSFLSCSNPAIQRGYGETPEELGQGVVSALNAKSETDLHKLRVDKDQYLTDLAPHFAKPGWDSKDALAFAWGNLNKKCLQGVDKWLKTYGGKDFEFVRIRFTEPTDDYKTFKLRRGTILTVKTAKGNEIDLRILGSVVEKDHYYRLLSYDD